MTHGMRMRYAIVNVYEGRIFATTDDETEAVRVAEEQSLTVVDGLTGERF